MKKVEESFSSYSFPATPTMPVITPTTQWLAGNSLILKIPLK